MAKLAQKHIYSVIQSLAKTETPASENYRRKLVNAQINNPRGNDPLIGHRLLGRH